MQERSGFVELKYRWRSNRAMWNRLSKIYTSTGAVCPTGIGDDRVEIGGELRDGVPGRFRVG